MADKKRFKKEHDFAVNAFRIVQEATGQVEPEPPKPKKPFDAKGMGHKGGLKGGKARAAKLTPEQRKEIAQKAAQKRRANILRELVTVKKGVALYGKEFKP